MCRMIQITFAIYTALTFSSVADTFRIGAWNIQDLHHQEAFSLRNFGTFMSVGRKTEHFDLLLKYRDQFGKDGTPADIIALQEIGTQAAMERIFPSSDYTTLMSSRWKNDNALEGEGKVYTGIAIRKASGIKFIEQKDLTELSVLHSDGNPVRTGTAALVELNGQKLWFLSVHLKSSCSGTKNVHTSGADDCQTLWKQMEPLANWIEERRAENIPFIIAGDFNRRFRQFSHTGPVWSALNGVEPNDTISEPYLTAHPENATRKCPTRKGTSLQPIDWIMMDASKAHWFAEGSFWERRFSDPDVKAARRGLSDHCPISIDIIIE